jgi:hypothetical protein
MEGDNLGNATAFFATVPHPAQPDTLAGSTRHCTQIARRRIAARRHLSRSLIG